MVSGRRSIILTLLLLPLFIAISTIFLHHFRGNGSASMGSFVHPVRDAMLSTHGNISTVMSAAVSAMERNQQLLEESKTREAALREEVHRLHMEVSMLRGGHAGHQLYTDANKRIEAASMPRHMGSASSQSQLPPALPPPAAAVSNAKQSQTSPSHSTFTSRSPFLPAIPLSQPPQQENIISRAEQTGTVHHQNAFTPASIRALSACLLDRQVNETVCVEPDIQFRRKWRIHLMPQDNPGKGWRFFHLINQGFSKHPYVVKVDSVAAADCVVWLPTSTNNPPSIDELAMPAAAPDPGMALLPVLGAGNNPEAKAGGAQSGQATKKVLIVLDEGDGSGFYPKASKMPYTIYFKRSWVVKRDGHYMGPPRRLKHAYFPMVYSASDQYHSGIFESIDERFRDVVCSLRCFDRQPARCRILGWTKQAAKSLNLKNTQLGEVNHGGRKEINKGYFGAMREAKIVVTCNPSHWEGDFRFFEAMVSGALVFVDEMWGPQPFALRHGEHVVVYDTTNQADFTKKLAYYLEHPAEARRIARNGYLHVLKYHRAVSRFDYFLRSAHHQDSGGRSSTSASDVPRYREISHDIKSDVTKAMIIQPKPPNWAR